MNDRSPKRWVHLNASTRRRTRPPGSHLLVPSPLIRSWVWPHADQESDVPDELVAVEVEGNVNVGGGELARWLREDGVIVVTPQIFHVLLTIGPFEGDRFDRGWRYSTVEDAMEAARAWDGVGDPPGPWSSDTENGDRLIVGCFNSGLLPVDSV